MVFTGVHSRSEITHVHYVLCTLDSVSCRGLMLVPSTLPRLQPLARPKPRAAKLLPNRTTLQLFCKRMFVLIYNPP